MFVDVIDHWGRSKNMRLLIFARFSVSKSKYFSDTINPDNFQLLGVWPVSRGRVYLCIERQRKIVYLFKSASKFRADGYFCVLFVILLKINI